MRKLNFVKPTLTCMKTSNDRHWTFDGTMKGLKTFVLHDESRSKSLVAYVSGTVGMRQQRIDENYIRWKQTHAFNGYGVSFHGTHEVAIGGQHLSIIDTHCQHNHL